ncbi:CPXCG motif-containing cysteine-rich protein [Catenovulum sp. SM1970]|uniref:CPXCG motif-containing cysteine-rich protein n=1 Tax=Marinifaba aquimaris TaxID=2741323 RepID=UPI0015720E52|nr:CPXCG motif-containing cysteine-rich protein [Marinifaba aquimaris]NTS78235.1 CPXCG motif-containing cysteine-rich protein [Marinifaba aquimaris]
MEIKDKTTRCPHCGHHIHLLIDASNGDQDYYEDCPVCCNAIHINFRLDATAEHVDLDVTDDR